MDFIQYAPLALRTAKTLATRDDDFEHACLGMVTEVGEFTTEVKRLVIYGKPLDPNMRTHMIEEIGDAIWYIPLALRAIGYSTDNPLPDSFCLADDEYSWTALSLRMSTTVGALSMQAVFGARDDTTPEMLSELLGLLFAAARKAGYTGVEAMTRNIAKLQARYPDAYTDHHAEARLDKAGASARES